MLTMLRYGAALMAGLATSLGSGVAAGALAPLVGRESEFFLCAVGLGLGLPLGGWVAGRVARPDLNAAAGPWFALLGLSPGLWLAVSLWTLELRRSGVGSEYFQEELGPGVFAILLGFGGAALGARKNVAGPDGPRDTS